MTTIITDTSKLILFVREWYCDTSRQMFEALDGLETLRDELEIMIDTLRSESHG